MFSLAQLLLRLLLIANWADASSSTIGNKPIVQQFSVQKNFSYCFTLKVGTPPQDVMMDIDFASADISITLDKDETSKLDDANSTLVSREEFVDTALISDGLKLSGTYVVDNFTVSDVNVGRLTFLLGKRDQTYTSLVSSSQDAFAQVLDRNLFGLGPRGLQAGVFYVDDEGKPGPVYEGLLEKVSNSTAGFSIWVDPEHYSWGELVLGGIDSTHYIPGSLKSLPIVNFEDASEKELTEPKYIGLECFSMTLEYELTSAKVSQNWSFNATTSAVAIMNSRLNFSMPKSTVKIIASQLGGRYSALYGYYLVQCSEPVLSLQMRNNFNLTINLSEYMVPIQSNVNPGESICRLEIGVADEIYLSNRVLSKYYIAVDYGSNQVMFGTPSVEPDSGQPAQLHEMSAPSPSSSNLLATTSATLTVYYPTNTLNPNTPFGFLTQPGVTSLSLNPSQASALLILSTSTNIFLY